MPPSPSVAITIVTRRRNVISWWVTTIISTTRRWCNVVVATVDSGHSAVDKPVGDRWLAWAWQEAGKGRDCACMYIWRSDKVVRWIVIVMGGILHHIVPDRASTCDTDDIVHDAVITVACPDADGKIGSIAHRPVIAETIGGTCFSGSGTIQFERVAR